MSIINCMERKSSKKHTFTFFIRSQGMASIYKKCFVLDVEKTVMVSFKKSILDIKLVLFDIEHNFPIFSMVCF